MHHAVRVISAARLTATPSSHHMAAQMIDKLWYDWQKKSTRNKYSYGGGSGSPLSDYTTYTEFPTGLPPFLNVSASSDLKQTWAIMVSHTLCSPRSSIARSPVTDYGTMLRFGM